MNTPIQTPCQTGSLCQVPKRRDEILESVEDEGIKTLAVEAVEASCNHETHPDDWFEDPGAGYGTPPFWRSQRAKARCFTCPIRLECLSIALEDGQEHGLWGGYTAAERDKVRDHRQAFLEGRINKPKEVSHAETQPLEAQAAE